MDKKLYEIFTILSPKLDETGANGFAQDLIKFLSEQEAELKKQDIQINERLAYPIKKNFNGHIVKLIVLAPAEKDIAKLVKEYTKTNEDILRLLTIIRPEIEEKKSTVIDQIRTQARRKKVSPQREHVTIESPSLTTPKAKKEEVADVAEIDKKIEELLG